jgi:SAM-dependent methyltransferase
MIDLTKLDPATTARHLRKPEGEIGRTLADSMSERNWSVYEAGYKRLGVQAGERLFEVGFGNGKLAPRLLALARGVTYTGIDFSETMVGEAEAFNRGLIEAGRAAFRFASVEEIPFAAGSFDRALTVNTIYFWPEPVRALAEIRRVLRPGGLLLVSVGNPEQMRRGIPFTRTASASTTRHGSKSCMRAPASTTSRSSSIATPRRPWTGVARWNANVSLLSVLHSGRAQSVALSQRPPSDFL